LRGQTQRPGAAADLARAGQRSRHGGQPGGAAQYSRGRGHGAQVDGKEQRARHRDQGSGADDPQPVGRDQQQARHGDRRQQPVHGSGRTAGYGTNQLPGHGGRAVDVSVGRAEARSTFAIRTILSRGALPLDHWGR